MRHYSLADMINSDVLTLFFVMAHKLKTSLRRRYKIWQGINLGFLFLNQCNRTQKTTLLVMVLDFYLLSNTI